MTTTQTSRPGQEPEAAEDRRGAPVTPTIAATTDAETVRETLARFGYAPGERLSVLQIHGTEPARGFRLTPAQIVELVAAGDLDDTQLYFSVSVVAAEGPKRGTAADVQRVPGIWADLDVKPGGLPDWDTARAVVETLADMLGTDPVVLVNSGHGLQPRWLVEPDDSGDVARMARILARFGELTRFVCRRYGGSADSVHDVSRVLRAPGTWNLKQPERPVRTSATFHPGRPLSADEIEEILDGYGVPEAAAVGDGTVRAPAGEWLWADQTCAYVRAMIDAWPTANGTAEGGQRHPWLMSQAVRLAAAHRQGCLTQAEHAAAADVLTARMAELCRRAGDPRPFDPAEVTEAAGWGVLKVETLTGEQCAAELGAHSHNGSPPEPDAEGEPDPEPDAEGDTAAGWEPWRPLDAEPTPRFPTERLPETVRRFAELVAARVQIDVVIPAIMALGVLAALAQKTARVAGPGWAEQLSLFVLGLADISERKSPACREVTAPLAAVEADLDARTADQRRLHNETRAILEGDLDAARRAAVKPGRDGKKPTAGEVADLAAKLDAVGPPMTPPRLRVDDVTTERLRGLMADNGGRIAVVSPELSFLGILEGNYTTRGVADLSAILSAYTGGEPIMTDRQGRPGERIPHPALTVVAVGQPERLTDLAAVKGAEDRGLVARFVLARAQRRAGSRTYSAADAELPPIPDTPAGCAWAELLDQLSYREPSDNPPTLHLDPAGLDLFVTFAREVEADLAEGGRWEHVAGFAGKAPGLALRFAGLLHLADYPDADGTTRIPADTVADAVELARWALASHLAALTGARLPEAFRHALRVVKAANRGTLTGTRAEPQPWAPFAVRDVQRHLSGPAGQLTAEAAAGVVELLTSRGYVQATSTVPPVRYVWRPELAQGQQ